MPTESLTGSCACGSSTYRSTSASGPLHLDFCYCTMCQRAGGGPFIAWIGVPKSSLTLSGPISEFSLSSIAKRTFCTKCGSNLTLQYDCLPKKTHITIATVVECGYELPKVGVHIFVKSKPTWYQIPEDGVERYDEFDTQFEEDYPDVVKTLRAESPRDAEASGPTFGE